MSTEPQSKIARYNSYDDSYDDISTSTNNTNNFNNKLNNNGSSGGSYIRGKPLACEISNPDTGEVIQVFTSFSQAERAFKIARCHISKACKDGGGILDGKYFRLIQEDEPDHPSNKKSPGEIRTNQLLTYTQFDADYNTSHPSITTSNTSPIQTATNDSSLNQTTDKKDLTIVQSNHTTTNNSTYKPTNTNNTTKNNQAVLTTTTPRTSFTCCPKTHFDITKLKPLHSIAQNNKKIVDLVCKGMNKVICCFRGTADAAKALNIERKIVSRMCAKIKEGKVTDEMNQFDTFYLKYSKSSRHQAYLYGNHVEDTYEKNESYVHRLARWKVTFEVEKENFKTPTESNKSEDSPKATEPIGNEICISHLNTPPSSSYTTNTTTTTTALAKDTKNIVTEIKANDLLNDDLNSLCIICQSSLANVIFDPCQHLVCCAKCLEKGHCKMFCPYCRTKYNSIRQPSLVKYVRPRIYSSYTFME